MASVQLHKPTTETCQNQNTHEEQSWFKKNLALPLIANRQKEHSTASHQSHTQTHVKEHNPVGWLFGQKHNTAAATKPAATNFSNHAPQDHCQKPATTAAPKPTITNNGNHAPLGKTTPAAPKTAITSNNHHAPQGPSQKPATAAPKHAITYNSNHATLGKTAPAAPKTAITSNNHHAPQGKTPTTTKITITNNNNHHAPQGPPCQKPAHATKTPSSNHAPKVSFQNPPQKTHQANNREQVVFEKNYTIAETDKKAHGGYGRNYTIADHVKTGNNAECKEKKEQQNANHCFRNVAGHVKQRITMMRGGHNDANNRSSSDSSSSDSSDSDCDAGQKKQQKVKIKHQKRTTTKVTTK